MRAVTMTQPGGTDVLHVRRQQDPTPGPAEALIRVSAAGVNFMDIGVRRGQLWTPISGPQTLGVEGSGQIIEVGEGVTSLQPGQRVAWAYVPGSYAEQLVAPVDALVPIPDAIDDRTAAAAMMQGLTASHFATDFYPVAEGDIALVHAAAGGLGLLLTQIIKMRGGQVIGRVSGPNKVAAAREAGADHVLVDNGGDVADAVIRITSGRGVDVVYDGSGPATFAASLASLRRSGTLCWYGPVLGGPGPIDLMSLPRSIKVGYAVFSDHIATPQLLRERAARLFDWIASGKLKLRIGQVYDLGDAARAHADMESRATTGKLLLIP